MKRGIVYILPSVILLLISMIGFSQLAIPPLAGKRVHDEAQILSSQTVQQLEQQLKLYEDSTSNQIAILIIQSLEGDILEDYALRVAHNEWKLGQAKNDNGVLLLIAVDDRKMRIEVGYGLEGVLTDATCNQIIRNEMAPNFRRGDYDAGVILAINAMVRAIGGEYIAEESSVSNNPEMTGKEKIFVGLFVFGILGMFTFAGLSSEGAPGWVLYFFLIPFYAVFPGAVFGWGFGLSVLVGYLIAFPILKVLFKKMGWAKKFTNTGTGGRSGGGWSSGSGWFSGGGSSGSSWGGGGGFSGGGGGFGGGGSSGSW
ncbi:MAG TPA: TPM domain-containing protein [Cyclobacteriaceae bacterium]